MKTVALTMIVKDEATTIGRCLESAHNFVDEIIVVDTGSTDNTKDIARSFGARVFDFIWCDDFSAARNFALLHASTDWNLVLDADEYITSFIKEEIQDFINNEAAIGRIKIVSKFKTNCEEKSAHALISRLFPRGTFYSGRIHEQIMSNLPHKRTNIVVHHDGYFEKDKFERNSKLLERELKENPYNAYLLYQLGREYKGHKDYSSSSEYFRQAYARITRNEGFYPSLVVEYLYNLLEDGQIKKSIDVIDAEHPYLTDNPDFHFVSGLIFLEALIKRGNAVREDLMQIEHCFLKCLELGESPYHDGIEGVGSFLAAYNLGVFYEVIGQKNKAFQYYKIAAGYDYKPALIRISLL